MLHGEPCGTCGADYFKQTTLLAKQEQLHLQHAVQGGVVHDAESVRKLKGSAYVSAKKSMRMPRRA